MDYVTHSFTSNSTSVLLLPQFSHSLPFTFLPHILSPTDTLSHYSLSLYPSISFPFAGSPLQDLYLWWYCCCVWVRWRCGQRWGWWPLRTRHTRPEMRPAGKIYRSLPINFGENELAWQENENVITGLVSSGRFPHHSSNKQRNYSLSELCHSVNYESCDNASVSENSDLLLANAVNHLSFFQTWRFWSGMWHKISKKMSSTPHNLHCNYMSLEKFTWPLSLLKFHCPSTWTSTYFTVQQWMKPWEDVAAIGQSTACIVLVFLPRGGWWKSLITGDFVQVLFYIFF